MNWNLTEYLPKVARCKQYFETIIVAFIVNVNNHMQEMIPDGSTPRIRQRRSSLSQQQLTPHFGVGVSEDASEYAKKLLSGDISRKLFE